MTESEFVVLGAEYQPGEAAFALLARETGEGLVYAGVPSSPCVMPIAVICNLGSRRSVYSHVTVICSASKLASEGQLGPSIISGDVA
jgi:hypothetical protein